MNNNKKGFTLAEVLITLTIIGVVAALTIPSLLANVNDKTYEAKRKGLQTRLAQAISQLDVLNSYEARRPVGYTGSENEKEYAEKYSTMNFLTEGLSKVYKLTNICEFENFSACDFPTSMSRWYDAAVYYTKNYSKFNLNTNILTADNLGGLLPDPAVVRTKNGESILLKYNPKCITEQDVGQDNTKIWTKEICLAMIVDIDGATKGPNSIGKDIFMGLVLYPDTPYLILINPTYVGAHIEVPSYGTGTTAESYCEKRSAHGFPAGSYTVPSREHDYVLAALYYADPNVWTSSLEGSSGDDYGWMVNGAVAKLIPRTTNGTVLQCVLKDTRR